MTIQITKTYYSCRSARSTWYLFHTRPLTLMYCSSPHCTEPAAACPSPSLSHCPWSSRTPHLGCCNPLTNIHLLECTNFTQLSNAWPVYNDSHSSDDANDELEIIYDHLHISGADRKYSQLSSCRVHTCLSMGYLVRSMLHAIVAVMLMGVLNKRIKDGSKTSFWCTVVQCNWYTVCKIKTFFFQKNNQQNNFCC